MPEHPYHDVAITGIFNTEQARVLERIGDVGGEVQAIGVLRATGSEVRAFAHWGIDFAELRARIAATSADLNSASNAQIINVEAVSAATAAAGVTINLSAQSEGFSITGSGFADIITGGNDADTIPSRSTT